MGSKDAGEQVTTTQPPEEIMPFLMSGLDEVFGRFRQGPTPVPEFSDPTQAAITGLSSTDPLIAEGSQFLSNALTPGDALENPLLADTFRQASDEVLLGLDSRFGASGRNVGAGLPSASIGLQNLAAGIYGPAFENERNRQVQQQNFAASLIPGFSGLDETRNLQAGQLLEGREREVNAGPDLLLNNFINQLGPLLGAGGLTQSTPLTSNPFSSALGGGVAGGTIGTSIGGPIGGGVGAGLGLLGGLLFS